MKCAVTYRVYPTPKQQVLLRETFGCVRAVYNRALAMSKAAYEANKKPWSMYETKALLPVWKKHDMPFLSEVDSMALQESIRNLDNAYKNFFRNPGKTGFPKFKSKYNRTQSYRTNKVQVLEKHIKLPKVGLLKAKVSREVPGRILSATVKRTSTGKYFVNVTCDDYVPCSKPVPQIDVLGIDAGVKAIATCSDGTVCENNHFLDKSQKKLVREQRRLSRKAKGSRNRAKQRVKVARVHEKIANQRKDCLNKFTTEAVSKSHVIVVENLNVKGMQKNRHLSRAVSDASMSEMFRQLEYKAEWYGRQYLEVDRFYPSSKTCSTCGHVYHGLTLREREWTCSQCNTHHDRDFNAAVNIANEGLRMLEGRAGHAQTAA